MLYHDLDFHLSLTFRATALDFLAIQVLLDALIAQVNINNLLVRSSTLYVFHWGELTVIPHSQDHHRASSALCETVFYDIALRYIGISDFWKFDDV